MFTYFNHHLGLLHTIRKSVKSIIVLIQLKKETETSKLYHHFRN